MTNQELEEELSDYKIEQIEEFLNEEVPKILKEIAKRPEPKTKEQKEETFHRTLRERYPIACGICGFQMQVDQYWPPDGKCYIYPTKVKPGDFGMKVNHEELRSIGSHEYHYMVHGVTFDEQWIILECPQCYAKDVKATRHYYEPKFYNDTPKAKLIEDAIASGIDDIINPSDYLDYYDD